VHNEAGLGHLSDGLAADLGGGERDAGEAGHADALSVGEERRAVDGLVKTREARRRMSTGHLAVTTYARMITGVAV